MTIKLLWLLNCLYEKIIFTKPFTSRPANSEKYILAKNFKGIHTQYLQNLYEVVRKWEIIEIQHGYIEDIFKGPLDTRYIDLIEKYNKLNMFHQIQIIKETLDIITEDLCINENQIIENQISKALEWCKKYNIDINFGSIYLQNYNKYKKYFDELKYEKWKINKCNYS